jgi:hypothetical protein
MSHTATWLLTVRDLSSSVTVRGQSEIWAALLFEEDAGVIPAVRVASTPHDALAETLSSALAENPAPSLIRVDGDVAESLLPDIRSTLSDTEGSMEIGRGDLPDWAEDAIVDLILHLGGHEHTEDGPTPEEWAPLYQQAEEYIRAAPWDRRADDVHLRLELRVGSERSEWIAVVLGAAGISEGLVVAPGRRVPNGDESDPWPPGTIHFSLAGDDAVGGAAEGLRRRAQRYSWPGDLAVPVFLEINGESGCDLSRRSSMMLTLGLAATLDHDRRSLGHGETITGQMILGSGRRGRYRVWLEAGHPPPGAPSPQVFSGEVRDDLLPAGTVFGLGCVFWPHLATVRASAHFRLDAPQVRDQQGDGLPVLLLGLPREQGETVAARIQKALPEGIAVLPNEDEALVVLMGATMFAMGAVPSNDEALGLFRRRLRASDGWHGIVITAAHEEPPECTVALFEFGPGST